MEIGEPIERPLKVKASALLHYTILDSLRDMTLQGTPPELNKWHLYKPPYSTAHVWLNYPSKNIYDKIITACFLLSYYYKSLPKKN